MLSRIKKRHIALLALLAGLMTTSLFIFQNDQQVDISQVRPYDEEKDYVPLAKLIHDNQFWIAEGANLSPEELLKWRAPHHDRRRKNEAKFAVVTKDGELGGFIAFYKESVEQGFIWLLAVDKKFRGQGFGSQLMTYALRELKKQGARYVTITVRTFNEPAIALYKKFGFVEESRNEQRGMLTLILRDL